MTCVGVLAVIFGGIWIWVEVSCWVEKVNWKLLDPEPMIVCSHIDGRWFWRCDWCGSTVEKEYEKNASLNHRGGCGLPCPMFSGKPEKWTRVLEVC